MFLIYDTYDFGLSLQNILAFLSIRRSKSELLLRSFSPLTILVNFKFLAASSSLEFGSSWSSWYRSTRLLLNLLAALGHLACDTGQFARGSARCEALMSEWGSFPLGTTVKPLPREPAPWEPVRLAPFGR